MKTLPMEFDGRADQRDYKFKVLKRAADVVLLEKVFKPHIRCDPGSNRGLGYEVCIVQTMPQKTWPDGRVTESHETLPKPSEWGTLGWSYTTLADAQLRYDAQICIQHT